MKKVVFIFWLVCHVGGFVLASYGVLREAFATTAVETMFSRKAFDERAFATGLTAGQEILVKVGVALGLIPENKELSVQERKSNAACAIAGVLLLVAAIVFDLLHRWLSKGS